MVNIVYWLWVLSFSSGVILLTRVLILIELSYLPMVGGLAKYATPLLCNGSQ